jgi:hypothetical protein
MAREWKEGFCRGDFGDEGTSSSHSFPHHNPPFHHTLPLEREREKRADISINTQAANAQRTSEPTASGIGGKIEEVAGKAAGCEGMEREGLERQEKSVK